MYCIRLSKRLNKRARICTLIHTMLANKSTNQLEFLCWNYERYDSGPVHTNAFSFENAYFFYPFSPSVHTNTIENGGVCLRKRRFSKTLSRVEVFENGGSASLCGRAKTEVFENDYVTGIGMSLVSLVRDENECFLIRFRGRSKTLQKR